MDKHLRGHAHARRHRFGDKDFGANVAFAIFLQFALEGDLAASKTIGRSIASEF